MALIKIAETVRGAATEKYFYREGFFIRSSVFRHNGTTMEKIKDGEIAEVPDDELDTHLATGLVVEVKKGTPINSVKEEDEDDAERLRMRAKELEDRARAGERIGMSLKEKQAARNGRGARKRALTNAVIREN